MSEVGKIVDCGKGYEVMKTGDSGKDYEVWENLCS